ncbi:MAG: sulfite exporter TauE/SafE family protein [Polyangiales bacterium]
MLSYVLLAVAAFFAGAINSVAGGGTLLTFPALLAVGIPPIAANATSTVALVPGSYAAFHGYREDLRDSRRELVGYAIPSVIGGVLGAFLVDRVGDKTFAKLVPWLIFSATALFAIQPIVRRWLDSRGETRAHHRLAIVMAFQLVVSIYGGFFGAGMGILMLASLGFLGLRDIHRMNGVKNFAAVCINGVAAVTFFALGRVRLPIAALMAVFAIVGGFLGAGWAKKLGQENVRRVVIGVGVAIGAVMLARRL